MTGVGRGDAMTLAHTVRDVLYRHATEVFPEPWFDLRRAYRARIDFRRAGVVFVHVPRAAGLSIGRTLYQRDIFHFTAAQLLRVSPDDVLALPRFAIVRNPWDRLISAYHFATLGGIPGGAQMRHPELYRDERFRCFDTFVKRYLAVNDVAKIDGVFRPQCSYLMLPDGSVPFDHVGRFEHLDETERWLTQTLRRPIRFPRINGTDRGHYRRYYTDETREIVANLYRGDLDAFGHEF